MTKLPVSQRAQGVIASPIRKFLPLIQDVAKRGIHVFKLNVGDPDIEPPKQFFKVVGSYSRPTLGYAPSPGILEHTQAWQKYYRQFGVKLDMADIIPTIGCAEAIMLAMQAVCDDGDEIIIFEPIYTSYKSFSVMAGVKLIPILLSIENNFAMPDIRLIEEKISKRTKAIVIINPDNPTGKLWSEKELSAIVGLAKRRGLFVISDETYREIRFDGKKPICLLACQDSAQNVIGQQFQL